MTLKCTSVKRVSELKTETLFRLKNLDENYFPQPWDAASWDCVFSTGALRLIVTIEEKDEFLGFALFEYSPADSFSHLLKILIDPQKRQKGLGQNLLDYSIKELKDLEIMTVFLEVEEENMKAIRLYEKNQFKVIHKKKHFYSNGATALIMTLEI